MTANRSARRLVGFGESEMTSRNIRVFVNPFDSTMIGKRTCVKARHRNGSTVDMCVDVSPVDNMVVVLVISV